MKKKTTEKNKGKRDIKKVFKRHKENLLQLRGKICKELNLLEEEGLKKFTSETSGDLSRYSSHIADIATDNNEKETILTLAATESSLLQSIDEALEKIENNIYGLCEICGKKISFERLNAIPYAKLCFHCQEKEEKK